VSTFLVGLLGAALATNSMAAVTNLVEQTTGVSVKAPETDDPIEKEFKKIEEDDDDAHEEVDRWIKENQEFAAKGAAIPANELNDRIMKRLDPIRKAYEDFIKRHPNHAKARVAYGSFLDGIGDEDGEVEQLEKARELDPKDPAIWNNLANYYGHNSPVKKAFEYYEKALSLDPNESIYYQNFGTTVFLFRKDAREYYNISEAQVFDKALQLYSNAMKLDPTNFPLASDVALSYYGIRPFRTNDALQSWTNTLAVAKDEVEREGVYLHLARWKITFHQFKEAHEHLNAVTNTIYADLKKRLSRNLSEREAGTNASPESLLNQPEELTKSGASSNQSPKSSTGDRWRY
jgi:tetratricopeptide (TPR) repeat protein